MSIRYTWYLGLRRLSDNFSIMDAMGNGEFMWVGRCGGGGEGED